MRSKVCTYCGILKKIDAFGKNSKCKDGKNYVCISCTRARSLNYYRDNKEILSEKVRAYRQTEKGKAERKKAREKYSKTYPEKRKARSISYRELVSGRLEAQPCEVCGISPAEMHHDDYSKPLDIRWLCKKHHEEFHRRQREKENK